MAVEAVLLDVDGTLVDSVDVHARTWTQAFAYFGVHATFAAVRAQIGKGGDQLMPVFVPPDRLAAIGEKLEAYRSALFRRELPAVRAFPGVRTLLIRLRQRGKRIVLASSGKAWEVAHHMRLCGIEQLVDGVTTGDDAERSKPWPDIFAAACAKAGVPPDRAMAIGDSPWDARAAANAGIRTIGLRSGGFPDDALRAAGCIALYAGPAALGAQLDASPLADCCSRSVAADKLV